MKQGGGTIDTSALANGRGLSAGSPSVAPVWNSSASVKTSVGTPSSYIPSYTSWYPSTHQDSMQQPQLMWRQFLADPAPLLSRRTRMRGARDPAARLSGPQSIQYRQRSHTLRSYRSTPHKHTDTPATAAWRPRHWESSVCGGGTSFPPLLSERISQTVGSNEAAPDISFYLTFYCVQNII